MIVHIVDGTYELFRHYFGAPSARDASGNEVGAVLGVATSMLQMLRDGATHLGVATDHVIESFRNELWPGYKSGEGIEEELLAQFRPLEETLAAMGLTVWAMVRYEADDAMASAAAAAAADDRVERVFLCTPDKDLGQCVVGERVVQYDRRKRELRDAAGVRERFGVEPESIPDYLALVGDSADGFPGVRGWGAKSSAAVLSRYPHLEAIPEDAVDWDVQVRGAARLADNLAEQRDLAHRFRDLATLRRDALSIDSVDELRWTGPASWFADLCASLGAGQLADQVHSLAEDLTE